MTTRFRKPSGEPKTRNRTTPAETFSARTCVARPQSDRASHRRRPRLVCQEQASRRACLGPSQLDCEQADRANDLIHSGHTLAIEADVAFSVAAVAVIAAGALWFTGAPESHTRIAVTPSSQGQVLLTATGSF
jgi:hypothetical protein